MSANTDANSEYCGRVDSDTRRQHAIAGAVRAEMARARKRIGELQAVLSLSGPTVSGRISGAYPFTIAELDRIATFLDITTQGILDSADLGEEMRKNRLDAVRPLPTSRPVDAWAQPPGSFRRRHTP